MKTLFWIFVVLLVFGAALAGYSSGHYDGVRKTRIETQYFLQDFARSTDLDSHLQRHGQQEWGNKLRAYGIVGPSSYIHTKNESVPAILAGIVCVAMGLTGLSFVLRSICPRKTLQQTATAPVS